MWERFCPTIQRPCIDGLADGENLVCVFWDSLDGKCNFVAGMTATRSFDEAIMEPMYNLMLEARQLQEANKVPSSEAIARIMEEVERVDAARVDAAKAREAIKQKQKEVEHHEIGAS